MHFHTKCSEKFFGTKHVLELNYSLSQMVELAKKVVCRSVTVPGVQAKLSMGLTSEFKNKGVHRLTIVGGIRRELHF